MKQTIAIIAIAVSMVACSKSGSNAPTQPTESLGGVEVYSNPITLCDADFYYVTTGGILTDNETFTVTPGSQVSLGNGTMQIVSGSLAAQSTNPCSILVDDNHIWVTTQSGTVTYSGTIQ